jgi:hypothetical protein
MSRSLFVDPAARANIEYGNGVGGFDEDYPEVANP